MSASSAEHSSAIPAAASSPRRIIREIFLGWGLILAGSALGLTLNAFSKFPVPLLDPLGPGAVPEQRLRISAEAYRQELEKGGLLLLDARSEHLLSQGTPLGAQRETPESLQDPERYAALDKLLAQARLVVVLCDSEACFTADRMAAMLEALGHPGAKVLAGGWEGYRAADLPLEGPNR